MRIIFIYFILSTTLFCETIMIRKWNDKYTNEICYEYTADNIKDLVKIVKEYSKGIAKITEMESEPFEYILMEDKINLYSIETEEKGVTYYLRILDKTKIKN